MKAAITGWGVPADRITVIPNCSDNSLFGNAGLREPERRRRGWDGQLVCLYPGAMGLSNGLDYLLDCAKILDQWQISGIHLALVGFGAHSQRLAARVASEGIRSAAVYDPVARMDMPRLLAAADVGLVCFLPKTCLAANSANKLFDFFAAGLPTVINYGGWQSELLRESGAGVSTDPSDPASLAKVLLQLRDTPELRAEMGGAGLRLAHQQFDRDALVRQLEELLRSIATTDRTSRALSRMA